MKNKSIYVGITSLGALRDLLDRLCNQTADPSTDPDWDVTCCGTDLYLNIDYDDCCITFDSEPLYDDDFDEDDYDNEDDFAYDDEDDFDDD